MVKLPLMNPPVDLFYQNLKYSFNTAIPRAKWYVYRDIRNSFFL